MREAEQLKKLTDYLKKNLKKGYTTDSLKWALIGQGYSRTAVDKAIEQTNKELAKEAPVLKEKPTIIHEVIDENNMPVKKKGFWARLFGD
jgi:hypothetical protein